jgi:acetyl/propionyl-CoA carboxylase alpha subunit
VHGHAFEARINAEDSWAGHLPQTGKVTTLELPHGDHIRWDAAIEAGAEISPHYDSMIGKLIVHAPSRTQALDRLDTALDELHIEGVTTNIEFHRWLTNRNEVRTAQVTTRFLDSTPLPHSSPTSNANSPWSSGIARRFTPHTSDLAFDSPTRDHRWFETAEAGGHAANIVAPFPGLITELHVNVGDHVVAGQPIVTIEAMKMLHPIAASGEGVVAAVHTTAGTQVAANDPLIDFTIPDTGDQP